MRRYCVYSFPSHHGKELDDLWYCALILAISPPPCADMWVPRIFGAEQAAHVVAQINNTTRPGLPGLWATVSISVAVQCNVAVVQPRKKEKILHFSSIFCRMTRECFWSHQRECISPWRTCLGATVALSLWFVVLTVPPPVAVHAVQTANSAERICTCLFVPFPMFLWIGPFLASVHASDGSGHRVANIRSYPASERVHLFNRMYCSV